VGEGRCHALLHMLMLLYAHTFHTLPLGLVDTALSPLCA
jgi:hypothetical protein